MVRFVDVEDPADPRLDAYRNLKDVAQRVSGSFIAESELVIERLVQRRYPVRSMLLTPQRAGRLEGRLSGVDATAYVAPQAIVDAVVGFSLHRGALALADRLALLDPTELLAGRRRVVVLEDVVDPDNVGAIFRHAAAFEADAVLLSPHCGDPLYRKAVRTSMGWVLSVPYARVPNDRNLIAELHASGLTTLALTPRADAAPLASFGSRPGERIALVLGAESTGLTDATIAAATHRLRIPTSAHVDSLNVASAAAIAMYELFRPGR